MLRKGTRGGAQSLSGGPAAGIETRVGCQGRRQSKRAASRRAGLVGSTWRHGACKVCSLRMESDEAAHNAGYGRLA